jgi:hypothetical protein
MKKILSVVLFMLVLSSCNIVNDIKYRDLYNHTDYFIEELYSFYGYESYGLEGTKYQKETANGEFQITPIGRLINVKRLEYTTNKEYEELKNIIKNHYKNNWKVKDVYICGYGTIMIDCRR